MTTEPQNIQDVDLYQELIDMHCPTFYFHPNEKYMPCSIDWLLERSAIYNQSVSPSGPFELYKPSPLTQEDLWNFTQEKYPGQIDLETCWFAYHDDTLQGQEPLEQVPVYAHVKVASYDPNIVLISYSLLYPYNGAKRVMGCYPVGDHYGDMEHVTVEVDLGSKKCTRMFFGAHTTKEGRWVDAADLQLDKDTFKENQSIRFKVYVAINSHAHYPSEGTVVRYYGFGNDVCSTKGKKWTPKAIRVFTGSEPQFDPKKDAWVMFAGRIGEDGIATMGAKDYIKWEDPKMEHLDPPVIMPSIQMGCCTLM